MWVEVSPRRLDFCGRPPCPLCFDWRDGDSPPMSGLQKMALDLLQKGLDDLSATQRNDLEGMGRRMHKDGLSAFAAPPEETPPSGAAVDIGMSNVRNIEGWLRERRQDEAPKAPAISLDEIADRKAAREAAEARKRKERNERLKEAREIAQVFAEADRGRQERQQYEDQRLLREVDPGFVDYCRSRGIVSAQDIYARWQREYGNRYAMPSYMVDPRKLEPWR